MRRRIEGSRGKGRRKETSGESKRREKSKRWSRRAMGVELEVGLRRRMVRQRNGWCRKWGKAG